MSFAQTIVAIVAETLAAVASTRRGPGLRGS